MAIILDRPPKRRWFQFTLRSLLVLICGCAVALGLWLKYIEPYRSDARIMRQLSKSASVTVVPRGPSWIRAIVGDDHCQRIVWVDLYGPEATDKDLQLLSNATELETLVIVGGLGKITDAGLKHLTEMKSISDLMIDGASDQTLRQVADVKQLTQLSLRGRFTDDGVQHLSVLRNLESLRLSSFRLTNDGLAALQTMSELRELSLQGTITDAGMEHLKRLKNLEALNCVGNPATARLVQELQRDTHLEFLETPLSDVTQYLSDFHDIPVRVDKQALEEAGLNPATPVNASITGVSLRKGLNRILDPLGLDWMLGSTGLTITTKQIAAQSRPGIIELQRSLPKLHEVEVDW